MGLFKTLKSFFGGHKEQPILPIETISVEEVEPIQIAEVPQTEDNHKPIIKFDALARLYPYQREAVTKTFGQNRGIVCLPTGLGKTFTQAAIIAHDILNNQNQFRMYVVNAPRIMLSFQLLKEVYSFLTLAGIEARYMFVHSGGKTSESELEDVRIKSNLDGNNIPFSEIGSGTSILGIKEMINKARIQSLPLIFFSTYNSAENIETARKQECENVPLSIVLNDEAQYLIQEQFHDILHILNSERCFFFTATMVFTSSDKGRGMNNVDTYGELLYTMTPREAIDMGKMVRPRLHFVKTIETYTADDYNRSLSLIIRDSFLQHEKIIGELKPKLLISVKGTQDIKTFLSSNEYKELKEKGVEIYAVASNEEIGNDVNEEKVKRQVFLKRLKEDGEDINKKIIILHYDVLSEGLDVSGITGILPLRTLNKTKFIQTFGRAARLDKEDRKKLERKELLSDDLRNFNKPYAYIIIPNIINSNEDDKENLIQLITELRSYGFNPVESIVSSSMIHGIPEVEELNGLNEITRRIPVVGQLIQNLEAELEAEKDAQLTKIELLTKYFK